jgi:hypothetical protein
VVARTVAQRGPSPSKLDHATGSLVTSYRADIDHRVLAAMTITTAQSVNTPRTPMNAK